MAASLVQVPVLLLAQTVAVKAWMANAAVVPAAVDRDVHQKRPTTRETYSGSHRAIKENKDHSGPLENERAKEHLGVTRKEYLPLNE